MHASQRETAHAGWSRRSCRGWRWSFSLGIVLRHPGRARSSRRSSAVPPWVIAGATTAHLLTLALRTEAWRTVLRAAGGGSPRASPVARRERRSLPRRNRPGSGRDAGANRAAPPLRRLRARPSVSQIALADAPIFMFEVCSSALLAAVASTAIGGIPTWVPWAMLASALGALRDPPARPLLASRQPQLRRRAGRARPIPTCAARLVLVVTAFTGMALLRTWIVLLRVRPAV